MRMHPGYQTAVESANWEDQLQSPEIQSTAPEHLLKIQYSV